MSTSRAERARGDRRGRGGRGGGAERLDPELEARRAAAMSFIRRYGDPVLKSRATAVDRFDDAPAHAGLADGRDHERRPGRRPRGAAARALAAAARLPRRARGAADRARQPRDRVVERRRRDARRRAASRSPASAWTWSGPCTCACAAQDEYGDAPHGRGFRARGARDPARDGPPRRRPDPRPHHARPAQGGDPRRSESASEKRPSRPLRRVRRRTRTRPREAARPAASPSRWPG